MSNILFTCVHSIECVIHTVVALVLEIFFFRISCHVDSKQMRDRRKKNLLVCTVLSIPSEWRHSIFTIHWINRNCFFPYYYSQFRLLLPSSSSDRFHLQMLWIICWNPEFMHDSFESFFVNDKLYLSLEFIWFVESVCLLVRNASINFPQWPQTQIRFCFYRINIVNLNEKWIRYKIISMAMHTK